MPVIQKKICLLGEFAVGKTSLVRRFVEGRFDDKYLSTIGVKISRKTIEHQDTILKLLIWDLAGGEDFSRMGPSYLQGSAGALIVGDLTRPDTLTTWVAHAKQIRAINPKAVLVFAANKADLVDERRVNEADLLASSQFLGGAYRLTSAKTGEGVEAAFTALADLIHS